MFAVIKTGGKQYKVAANDVLKIEKLPAMAGEIVTFDQVLMVGEGADVTLGAPLVEGALVAAELIETKKQKTIIVFKKNRRHNYRRRNGHRQLLSSVRITEILTGGAQPSIAPRAQSAAPVETASEKPAKRAKKSEAADEPVAAEAPVTEAVAEAPAAADAAPEKKSSRKAKAEAAPEGEAAGEAAAPKARKSKPKADKE